MAAYVSDFYMLLNKSDILNYHPCCVFINKSLKTLFYYIPNVHPVAIGFKGGHGNIVAMAFVDI